MGAYLLNETHGKAWNTSEIISDLFAKKSVSEFPRSNTVLLESVGCCLHYLSAKSQEP